MQGDPRDENNKSSDGLNRSPARPIKNIQFMVKDSKENAATHGWGFADVNDCKPAHDVTYQKCFPCHYREGSRIHLRFLTAGNGSTTGRLPGGRKLSQTIKIMRKLNVFLGCCMDVNRSKNLAGAA